MTGNSLLYKDRKKEVIVFGIIIAVCFSALIVHAGAIGDIVVSIVSSIVNLICSGIMACLLMVAQSFLNITSISITKLETYDILTGFVDMAPMLTIIGTSLAALFFMAQLISTLFGPMLGAQQQSIGGMVVRGFVFIPLTYFMQDLMLKFLDMMQGVYSALLEGEKTVSNSWNFFTNWGEASIDFGEVEGVEGTIVTLATIVICALLQIIILWEFLKFLLEMTQRFVALIIYAYLSPLAAACAVSPAGGQILKQTITVFMSSSVLWFLNIWCVGIMMSLFSASEKCVASGADAYFLWTVVTYGFIKIAQQLDDLFNAVGASNVRFSGSVMDSLVSAGHLIAGAAKLGTSIGKGIGNLKGKLGSYVNGRDPSNPTAPTEGPRMNNGTSTPTRNPAGNASTPGKVDMKHGAAAAAASGGNAAQVAGAAAYSAGAKVANKVKNSLPGLAVQAAGKFAKEKFGAAAESAAGKAAAMAAAKDTANLNKAQQALDSGNVSQMSRENLNTPLSLSSATQAMQQAGLLKDGERVSELKPSADGKSLTATVLGDGYSMRQVGGLTSITPDAQTDNANKLNGAVASGATAALSSSLLNDPSSLKAATAAMRADGILKDGETVTGLSASADGKTLNAQVAGADGKPSRVVNGVSNVDPNMRATQAKNIQDKLANGEGGSINRNELNTPGMLNLATDTLSKQQQTGGNGTILRDGESVVAMGVSEDGKSLDVIARSSSGDLRTISGVNKLESDSHRKQMSETYSLDSLNSSSKIEFAGCGTAQVSKVGEDANGCTFKVSGGKMGNGESFEIKTASGVDSMTAAAAIAGNIPADKVLTGGTNVTEVREALTGDANARGSAQTVSVNHNSANTSFAASGSAGGISVNAHRVKCGESIKDDNGNITGYTNDVWSYSCSDNPSKTATMEFAHGTGANEVLTDLVNSDNDSLSQMREHAGITKGNINADGSAGTDACVTYYRGAFDSGKISNGHAQQMGEFSNIDVSDGRANLTARSRGQSFNFDIEKTDDGGWNIHVRDTSHNKPGQRAVNKNISLSANDAGGMDIEELSASIIGGNGADHEPLMQILKDIGIKQSFDKSSNRSLGALLRKAQPGGTADNAVGK